MGIVSRPASWMVNLELEVGEGPGDWPFFFCCIYITIFIILKSIPKPK